MTFSAGLAVATLMVLVLGFVAWGAVVLPAEAVDGLETDVNA